MVAEITSVLTVISSLLGISKDSIDLRNKAKQLFKSSNERILEGIMATKKGFRKEELEQVYLAVSASRPLAHSVFRKLRGNFMVSAAMYLGYWLCIAYLLYTMGSRLFEGVGYWAQPLMWLVAVMAYGSKNWVLPRLKQLPTALRLNADDYLDVRGLIKASRQLKNRSFEVVSGWAGTFGLQRISVRERTFLNTFARLTALLNALESYVLIEKMERSFGSAYDWFSNEMLNIVVGAIENLVELKRLIPKPKNAWEVEQWQREQEQTLRHEFSAAGMEDLIDPKISTSYSMFVGLDFAGLVQSGRLADEIRNYTALGNSGRP